MLLLVLLPLSVTEKFDAALPTAFLAVQVYSPVVTGPRSSLPDCASANPSWGQRGKLSSYIDSDTLIN